MESPTYNVHEVNKIPYQADSLWSSYKELVSSFIPSNVNDFYTVWNPPLELHAVSLSLIKHDSRRSLIAEAPIGSGKTTSVVLAALSIVDPTLLAPQALLVCPNRDLAVECLGYIRVLSRGSNITTFSTLPNTSALTSNTDSHTPGVRSGVIVGTPESIHEFIAAHRLQMSTVKVVAFDDLHIMANNDKDCENSIMILREVEITSPLCRVLLFTSSYTKDVLKLATNAIDDRVHYRISTKAAEPTYLKHFKVNCSDQFAKIDELRDFILKLGEGVSAAVIFVKDCDVAKSLKAALVRTGFEAFILEKGMRHEDRDRTLKEFRDGAPWRQIFITSEVICGFNAYMVNLIINFDIPVKDDGSEVVPDFSMYKQRIGRLWYGGHAKGAVFNLLSNDNDAKLMAQIERHFGIHVKLVRARNFEDYSDASGSSRLLNNGD